MRKKFIGLAMAGMLFGMNGTACATLIVQGTVNYAGAERMLIYDSDQDITWLDYSHGGEMWRDQNGWAETDLTFNIGSITYTDWRQPEFGELMHLFSADHAWQEPESPFQNLLLTEYWSGSEASYAPGHFYCITGNGGYGIAGEDYIKLGLAVIDGRISQPVPEPATMLLLSTGIASLVGTRLKRKK